MSVIPNILMEHDRSLAGDVFKLAEPIGEARPTFDILPRTGVRPKLLDVAVRNEQARATIQSYLNGSYHLDPVELYRLTVGLDRGMNENIDAGTIGKSVEKYWENIGSKEVGDALDFGQSVYRMSKPSLERQILGSREHVKSKNAADMLLEKINCIGGK